MIEIRKIIDVAADTSALILSFVVESHKMMIKVAGMATRTASVWARIIAINPKTIVANQKVVLEADFFV